MLHINQRSFRRNINSCNPPAISGELHGSTTAKALGITVKAAYAPALALCRALIRAGVDPNTRLDLYRRTGVLALRIRKIGEGARA
jgi:hypothetical protein